MIDLLDPALANRDAVLDELRAVSPIAWREGRRGPGYWAVTGYPELVAIARDPATFTSYLGTRPEVRRTRDAARPLHNLDPPAHTELRKIAARLVAPDRIAALPIDAIIATALDRFTGGDAIAELAIPVTSQIFAAWLGIADAAALHREVEAVHSAGAAFLDDPEPHRAAAAAASNAIAARMQPFARELALPALTGTILATLLVEAGIPTTIDAIGNGLAALATKPADLATAIEETLRLGAPIQQFARYATREIAIAGASIRPEQQVILWFGAANRDPRRDGPHVSFGIGPHRCLGAAFARTILAAFFSQWFARVPFHRASGERRASSYMNGFARLEVAF